MKKRLAFLLVIVMVLGTMMMACGSKTKLEGTTWSLTSIEAEGVTFKGDELKSAMGGETTFEFKKDGVIVATAAETETEGTWSLKGDKITIDLEGGKAEGTVDGSKMTIDQDGTKMVFEKK
jgi:lipopolysaccharide export system protein LptA